MTVRERAHKLIDELPDERVEDALVALEALEDPAVVLVRDVPLEDEEISSEEEAAVQEARDELAAGVPTISHADIKREFGME